MGGAQPSTIAGHSGLCLYRGAASRREIAKHCCRAPATADAPTKTSVEVSLHGEAEWFDEDRVTFLNRDVVLAGLDGRNLDHDFVRGLRDDDRFVVFFLVREEDGGDVSLFQVLSGQRNGVVGAAGLRVNRRYVRRALRAERRREKDDERDCRAERDFRAREFVAAFHTIWSW